MSEIDTVYLPCPECSTFTHLDDLCECLEPTCGECCGRYHEREVA